MKRLFLIFLTVFFFSPAPSATAQQHYLLNRTNLDQINNLFVYMELNRATISIIPKPSARFRSKVFSAETDAFYVSINQATGKVVSCMFRTRCDPVLYNFAPTQSDCKILKELLLRNGKPLHHLVEFGCDFEKIARTPKSERAGAIQELDGKIQRFLATVNKSDDKILNEYSRFMVGSIAAANYDMISTADVKVPAINKTFSDLTTTLGQITKKGIRSEAKLPLIMFPGNIGREIMAKEKVTSLPKYKKRLGGIIADVSDKNLKQFLFVDERGLKIIRFSDKEAVPNWNHQLFHQNAFRWNGKK